MYGFTVLGGRDFMHFSAKNDTFLMHFFVSLKTLTQF